MINQASIQKWANQLARQFHPEKIILFGSYAYGQPGRDSDVDLFVIMRHEGTSIKMASEIRLALPAEVPIDVVVRTPEKAKRRLEMNDYVAPAYTLANKRYRPPAAVVVTKARN